MRPFAAAAGLAFMLALSQPTLAQSDNTAGTASGNAPASSGLSGIDMSQAGNTPETQRAWFGARSKEEQARIMQSCNDLTAVNAKMMQQETTGSTGAATTSNSAANVDSTRSSTGMSLEQMKGFCDTVK